MKSQKGAKLVYSHIFERLDDRTLYSLFMIRKFAMDHALLKPGPDDGPDVDTKRLEDRLRCALGRATSPTYPGRHLPEQDGSVMDRGKIEPGWYGATVKLFLIDQWPKEKKRLEKVRRRMLASQKAGMVRGWAMRLRPWLAVAFIVAAACGAPPVRDVIGILLKEGVSAAREVAYSVTPKTPEAMFQQGWVDYWAGEYEEAAQKAHTILSGKDISGHTQAGCWYLLGSVDWETGSNDAALANFRKAYGLYESGNDIQNMYQTTLAMAKVDISIDDFEASNGRLQAALSLYDLDDGKHIPHLGEYHATAIELAAKLRDSETALEHARKRHAIYQQSGQLDFLAASKSDLGFWLAANGCFEQAQLYTVEASRIIFKLNDEIRFIYNELNWVLIHRLQGTADPGAVGSIKEWAKSRGDSRLDDLLELALTLEPTKEYVDDEPCHENLEPK